MSCVTIIFGTYKQHLINNNDDNKLMSSICLLITSLRITTRTISACFDPEHCTQIVPSCYNKAITLDIEFTSYTIVVSIMNEWVRSIIEYIKKWTYKLIGNGIDFA
jgi:hypothetical protein